MNRFPEKQKVLKYQKDGQKSWEKRDHLRILSNLKNYCILSEEYPAGQILDLKNILI
jgi:hypothetical protein